ncbi:MAG: ABC transporter substrate-binding protein [Candidatus Hermodarchaeota archaeon]
MKKSIKVSLIGILALVTFLPLNPILASTTSIEAPMADTLIILHPHSADFAGYVISGFRNWYSTEYGTTIDVTTLEKDSGDCYTEVDTWAGSPGADVWWGGGRYYFELARNDGWLQPYTVAEDGNISDIFNGWPMKEPASAPEWYAAAISGFGIMYNEEILTTDNLPIPTMWTDLADPKYQGYIVMCNPDDSGSTAATVKQIIMEMNDQTDSTKITTAADISEAWQFWAKVSGNVGVFTTSSSAVPAEVYEGNYAIGITIDYYAWAKMALDPTGPFNFNYGGASTFSPDPAAVLAGAPNMVQAKRFMDYLISTEGQEKVGAYRIPANIKAVPDSRLVPRAWDDNGDMNPDFPAITPFNVSLDDAIHYPVEKLYNYWLCKNHDAVKTAWIAIDDATDATAKVNALDMYTTFPPDFNGTMAGLMDLDTGSANRVVWQNFGKNSFGNATLEAAEDYGDPIIHPTLTTSTTEPGTGQAPGFEIILLLTSIGTLVLLRRRKK